MTKRYIMSEAIIWGIAVLNNKGFSAPKFSDSNILKNQSDSPASKKVTLP